MTIIFIILVPILLMYSSGYRLDDALSVVKTGGIYIHSDLSNTRVHIDGDFVEDNGVLLKNTLIQNLRPNKVYKVRVEKDGYYTWEKDLYVRPNLVTEGRILMLEVNKELRTVSEFLEMDNTNATSTIENPEYLEFAEYFKEDMGQFDEYVATTTMIETRRGLIASSTLVVETNYPEYILKSTTKELDELNMVKERGGNLSWLQNGIVFISYIGKDDALPYYYCVTMCKEELSVSLPNDIVRYDFYPGRDDVIIALTKRGIFAVEIDDRSNQNIQPVMEAPGLDFRVRGNSIIIFDGKDFLERR